ncbi:putative WD40 repeats [Lyophyllum shimeji]|uniref:WD40 repeats n=1 Tax=Lyophyllum shimeji TaxID=47721 RepID=A0A9P3UKR0_LYOSH|nr:putative WD40 repeats [Lyophyllum shimeji]
MAATMLAISATGTLSVLDSAVLKRGSSLVSSCLALTQTATSSAWSLDNAFLYLASAQGIQRYDPSSNSLRDIYTSEGEPTFYLLCKDKGTLIYGAGDKVHLLECSSSAKITQTFDSHKSPITSLSLSNDCTLLASTSLNAVHIHNLTLGSHTVLRGLPSTDRNVTTSAFHPHARTRLLVGIGKQILVYDTTRPSGPLKTIPLNETTSGEIVAVACSPFSKTLVAVASAGGHVGLIDLEKEKGLFRTLNVKVPLTSLGFSPEGGSIYLGTEHGKLLVIDLRALDKAPKTFVISEAGCRIETMSVQRKLKAGEAGSKAAPTMTATSAKPATRAETAPSRRSAAQAAPSRATTKEVASPARARVTRANSTASPARRVPSAMSKESVPSAKLTPKKQAPEAERKVFSPVRDPLGNSAGDISVQLETLGAVTKVAADGDRKTSISTIGSRLSSSPNADKVATSISATSTRRSMRHFASEEADPPRRVRTVPAATRTRNTTSTVSQTMPTTTTGSRLTVATSDTLHPPSDRVRSRSRAASSASRAGSETTSVSATSASTGSTRPSSSLSRTTTTSTSTSPPLSHAAAAPLPVSRTPSPELPDIREPITPVPAVKKAKAGMGVLGLGTPEVERWIQAGKGEDQGRRRDGGKNKGKTVGFMDDGEDGDDSDGDDADERERQRSLTMQVSPRRPSTTSWAPSPLRQSPGGSAHDFLRTIVKDVMYDFQRETRAEMMGLHLDLVRMGRGWKKELRELMEEYVGGMNELREENRRLREENERLRRGY